MQRTTIAVLRVVLVAFCGVLLLTQVWVLPVVAAELAAQYPEAAHVRLPVLVAAIATGACAQVATVSVWELLTLVQEDRIFDAGSRHVDVFITAAVVATVLVTATNAFLILALGQTQPGMFLGLSALTVVGAGTALLMVVMRALLTRAVRQRAELAGVV